MSNGNNAAPAAFAESARVAFLYAPLLAVGGVIVTMIGALVSADGNETGTLFTILGIIAYVGAAIFGFVGISGMINAGQHLLERHHEAAAATIRGFRTMAESPAFAEQAVDRGVAEPRSVQVEVPEVAADPQDLSDSTLLELLEGLGITDDARNIRRMYGKSACASFINRKASEQGVANVLYSEHDIPDQF